MRNHALRITVLLLLVFCGLARAETYPQFDVTGYKKWNFYRTQVDPTTNFFLAQTHLGGLSQATNMGPWQERLLLKIHSKLNERLSVTYDIEQEPESPQKSDVIVKYDNTELTFGDFTASFSENEFVSANKYVNGVMLTSFGDNYYFKIVPSSKVKSSNQSIASQNGNNTRGPYYLGHGTIVEGSEKIILNNIVLERGVDYTIDYFEGKATFTKILLPTDTFTYSFEYTNIVDLFFPTISKRDFVGASGNIKVKRFFFEDEPVVIPLAVTAEAREKFPKFIPIVDAMEMAAATSEAATSEAATPEAEAPKPKADDGIARGGARPKEPEPATLYSTEEAISYASDEMNGIYRLPNFPVVEFSEQIKLNGMVLKQLEDYSINYSDGRIFVLSEMRPTEEEPLTVTYSYYSTSRETENISGIDSVGPYQLAHRAVTRNSETLFVDDKRNFRDLDYTIDYDLGKVTFYSKISAASTITISYDFTVTVTPPTPESGNALSLGATYLKESAKKGSSANVATVIEAYKGSQISNGLLNLKHVPVDSSQPVVVTVNGTSYANFYVPTSDAQSQQLPYITDSSDPSDGYATGALKFLTTLNATDEITVTYTYKKSIYGKFTGSGNGSTGPYYLTGVTAVVPGTDTNLLVRKEGSDVIETYIKNSSRESFDGKYKINYNYPYIPYVTFNDPFEIGKKFEITYYYVPTSSTTQVDQDIMHDIMGVTTQVKLGNNLIVDGAYAKSRSDQAIIAESASDTIAGANTRGPYSLSHQNVIEASENVSVNGFRRNRDIDYFINYASGQLTFYYLTLTPSDRITVDYNYQSSSGISGTTEVREGNAYKFAAAGSIAGVSIGGVFKEIEPEYAPFESTNIGAGSQQKGFNLAYSPGSFFSLTSSLLETKSQIGTYKGYFSWNTDRNMGISMNPADLVRLSLNFRNYKSTDDVLPGASTNNTDSISDAISGSITPRSIGNDLLAFSNTNDFSRTETRNNLNQSSSMITYLHTNNKLNIAKRANFGLDYQLSEPISQTPDAVTSHEISKDMTYDFDWDLTFGFIKRLTTRAKVITHDQNNLLTNASTSTKNQSINFAFDPFSNLSTTLDKSRQEVLSVQVGKDNPVTERNQYTVRTTPFSFIRLPVISTLTFNYINSDDNSLQETGARSNGIKQNISTSISPFSFITFFAPLSSLSLSGVLDKQDRTNTAVSGTLETKSNLLTESRTYTAGTRFPILNLVSVTGDYSYEDYSNIDTLGTIYTKTQNTITRAGASMQPLPILSVNGNYNLKITKDLVTTIELPKENMDATATLKVFNWGNLVYNWALEKNKGEVQAGVVTGLNVEKYTETYTFTSTIPQSSVVLSSIVLSANFKQVTYYDFLTPTNNFRASLLSFEGSLNF